MKSSVKIGPSFFVNELKDYDDWRWAMVREAAQNSIDAKGSEEIHFTITEEDGSTIFSWSNDGEPMTEDILVNKLFALGESGKRFNGTTGGFGKAKVLLYFTHASYEIRTGNLLVVGSGADYEVTESEYYHGTHSIVRIDGYHADDLISRARKFVDVAQWSGMFYINGDPRSACLRKGSPRRDLGFGKVYTNKSFNYRMIVRINGVPMFITGIGLDRCVIVELSGKSDEVLTSNRDGLVSPYRNQLSDFVTELAVDKRSALKRRGPRYIEYRGTKICHKNSLNVAAVVGDIVPAVSAATNGGVTNGGVTNGGVTSGIDAIGNDEYHPPVAHELGDFEEKQTALSYIEVKSRNQVATIGTNFLLKNETDLKIPAYYDPGSGEFSSYSNKLVRIWGRIMLEIHRMFDFEAEFSVGFIFDESSDAEFENESYGKVYYLNPCTIVEQSFSNSKSFRKRFKLTEKDRLIMIGLHEFVHCLGYRWHDERYACKFTDLAAVVLKKRSRFNWCFK